MTQKTDLCKCYQCKELRYLRARDSRRPISATETAHNLNAARFNAELNGDALPPLFSAARFVSTFALILLVALGALLML